jgi:hypothetical protein
LNPTMTKKKKLSCKFFPRNDFSSINVDSKVQITNLFIYNLWVQCLIPNYKFLKSITHKITYYNCDVKNHVMTIWITHHDVMNHF